MTRIRAAWAAWTSLAVLLVWAAAQVWLTHRGVAQSYAHAAQVRAALRVRFPDMTFLGSLTPHASEWLLPALASAVAFAVVLLAAAALAWTGRRRSAAVLGVAAALAPAAGRFGDAQGLGLGWLQPGSADIQTWYAAGTAVDAVAVLAAVLLVLRAVEPVRPAVATRAVLVRALPPLIAVAGWWQLRHAFPDAADLVWLARAVVAVLAVALLTAAGSRLLALGAVAVLPWADAEFGFGLLTAHTAAPALPNAGVGLWLSHSAWLLAVAAAVAVAPYAARSWRRVFRAREQVAPASA